MAMTLREENHFGVTRYTVIGGPDGEKHFECESDALDYISQVLNPKHSTSRVSSDDREWLAKFGIKI